MGFASCCRLQAFLVKIRKEEADFFVQTTEIVTDSLQQQYGYSAYWYTTVRKTWEEFTYDSLLI